jgi:hypothetical protein
MSAAVLATVQCSKRNSLLAVFAAPLLAGAVLRGYRPLLLALLNDLPQYFVFVVGSPAVHCVPTFAKRVDASSRVAILVSA